MKVIAKKLSGHYIGGVGPAFETNLATILAPEVHARYGESREAHAEHCIDVLADRIGAVVEALVAKKLLTVDEAMRITGADEHYEVVA